MLQKLLFIRFFTLISIAIKMLIDTNAVRPGDLLTIQALWQFLTPYLSLIWGYFFIECCSKVILEYKFSKGRFNLFHFKKSISTIAPLTEERTIPADDLSPYKTFIDEFINYTHATLRPFLSDEELIRLIDDLKLFILREEYARNAVSRRISNLHPQDILHYGWNIISRIKTVTHSQVKKYNNQTMAQFLKDEFSLILSNWEVSTIARKMASDDGKFTIPLIDPTKPLIDKDKAE